jgi:hypothetical protein
VSELLISRYDKLLRTNRELIAERNKALDANAALLSENCKLILERDNLNGYLQEIFDAVNIPMDTSTALGPLMAVREIMRRWAVLGDKP